MASTADIRKGLCLELDGNVVQIVEFQKFQMGRGGAFVRTKIRNMETGKVTDHTFQSGHKINEVRVERRKFQYLYPDDMGLNFMDQETYAQVSIKPEMIDNSELLKEGDTIDVLFNAEKEVPLTVELPPTVVLRVEYTEPAVKGDTSSNATKEAKLETGAIIKVPLFVNNGDLIKIDTVSKSYIERTKE